MTTPSRLEGPVRRLGVVYREHTPEVLAVLERVRAWASGHDVDVLVEPDAGQGPGQTLDLVAEPVDLLVALGGDGTFLRASRLAVGTEIPVLGVNLGRLGFLTAVPDSDVEAGLDIVMKGEALLERRHRLRATVDGREFYGLNDIVVHTSGAARVTPLTLSIGSGDDLEAVGSFGADGVIVATPTGSTAYSMSAGGPIIVPEVDAVVVTPICPHSLAVRPLVVHAEETICIGSLDPEADHKVTVDGQVVHRMSPGEQVFVERDDRPLWLVRMPGQTFFRTLRKKLNWAVRSPERS